MGMLYVRLDGIYYPDSTLLKDQGLKMIRKKGLCQFLRA